MEYPSLDVERLRAAVSDTRLGPIDFVAATGSTNADLLAAEPEHLRVLLAREQTAARGRLGRGWSSPPGSQLICSVSLVLGREVVEKLGTLTLAVGVALTDVVDRAELKWPNDVLIDGRKLVGILAEASPLDDGRYHVVVGFGMNTFLSPEQLPVAHATSLAIEGVDVEPTELAERVLRAVDKRLSQWETDDPTLIQDYRAVCSSIGQRVRLEMPTGNIVGEVDDVADDGRISVDGELHSAGDVTHLRRDDSDG